LILPAVLAAVKLCPTMDPKTCRKQPVRPLQLLHPHSGYFLRSRRIAVDFGYKLTKAKVLEYQAEIDIESLIKRGGGLLPLIFTA
jgi:hypothetical protein